MIEPARETSNGEAFRWRGCLVDLPRFCFGNVYCGDEGFFRRGEFGIGAVALILRHLRCHYGPGREHAEGRGEKGCDETSAIAVLWECA